MGGMRKDLCAKNLAGWVFLTVFDGTFVTGWEEKHLLVAHNLTEVVVEIACLIGILHHKQQFAADFLCQCAKRHGYC